MASQDGGAFSFDGIGGGSSSSSRHRNLFCSQCQEAQQVSREERTCPICGAQLTSQPPSGQQGGSAGLGGLPQVLDTLAGALANRDLLQHPEGRTLLQLLEEQLAMIALGQGGDGGGGAQGFMEGLGGGVASRGTPSGVMDRLPRQVLHRTSSTLLAMQVTATTTLPATPQQLQLDAIPAEFSGVPVDKGEAKVVVADPITVHTTELMNGKDQVNGRIVIAKRGKAPFSAIALRAKAAGAVGVVLIQHVDVWPYLMKDSEGVVHKSGGLGEMWIAMVKQEEGQALLSMVEASREGHHEVTMTVSLTSLEAECVICQEAYEEGMTIIKLPCQHGFHEDCLTKWLKLNHTCPTCRYELPRGHDDPLRARGAAEQQRQEYMERIFS